MVPGPEVLPRSGLIQLGVAVVLLSSAWPVTKTALTLGASPLWFAVGRAGLSAVAAFAALAVMGRLRLPRRADRPAVLAVGLLQLAGFFGFAHAAAAWIPAGRTGVLSNVTTIWLVPLSMLVLGETISARRWCAAGCGMAGVGVLMSPWSIDWHSGQVVLGHLLLMGAGLSWSAAIVIVRRWPPRSTMLQLVPWCFGLATLVLLPLALLIHPEPGHWGMPALAALGYIGLVAGPIGTWCIMEVTAVLPTMVSSIGFLLSPALGLLLSAWFLGEALTPDLIGGAVLILASVALAAWPGRRSAKVSA